MGGKKQWRGKRKAGKGGEDKKEWKYAKGPGGEAKAGTWSTHEKYNEKYVEYYKGLGIVPEDEVDAFVATLQKQLPITFRINGSGKYAEHVKNRLRKDFLEGLDLSNVKLEGGEEVSPPMPLPWYPNEVAWQMNFSRNQLRKEKVLTELFEFIKAAAEAGTITRQEAVSMIPPLFLDVKPGHAVLDMCAAPGSKTFQILEMLHAGGTTFEPEGYVVANDVDPKRCNLLTHQTKRMCSPALIVTNHDATRFPQLPSAADGEERYFDRVLADVPCSGDGTLRKNADIWAKWHTNMGCQMHKLQLSCALQCARLTKVGGRLVYSTCSLNPVEDEAVVNEMLTLAKGSLELVDAASEVPGLKLVAGLRSWKLMDDAGWIDRYAPESRPMRDNIMPSMFPSPSGPDPSPHPLERCMRFLPHHSDTGGFFVAVLTKVAELPIELHQRKGVLKQMRDEQAAAAATAAGPLEDATSAAVATADQSEDATPAVATATDQSISPEEQLELVDKPSGPGHHVPSSAYTGTPQNLKAKKGRWNGVDPTYMVKNEELLTSLVDFYGYDVAKFKVDVQLMTRTPDDQQPKRLYFCAKGVTALLTDDTEEKLKIVCAGVKCFERQDKDALVPCNYRLSQEGLQVTLPNLTKQKVILKLSEYAAMLEYRVMPIKSDETETAQKVFSPESLASIEQSQQGCCIVLPDISTAEECGVPKAAASTAEDLAIVCWLGKVSLSLMVSKPDCSLLLDRIGLDPSKAHAKPNAMQVKRDADSAAGTKRTGTTRSRNDERREKMKAAAAGGKEGGEGDEEVEEEEGGEGEGEGEEAGEDLEADE